MKTVLVHELGEVTGEEWLADRIRRRLAEENQNYLAVAMGPTGSGKSYSFLRLASLSDPGFTIERVVFDVKGFLRLVNTGLPPGSVILWDEAGLGISARNFQTTLNKVAGYVMQSFRFLNLCLLLTVPDPSFIDKVPRTLFHLAVETVKVNRSREWVYAKPFDVKNNPRIGKVYTPHPIMKTPDGPVKLKGTYFRRPPKPLTDAYEKAREVYMRGYYVELEREILGEGPSRRLVRIKRAREVGLIDRLIAHIEGVSRPTITRLRNENEIK